MVGFRFRVLPFSCLTSNVWLLGVAARDLATFPRQLNIVGPAASWAKSVLITRPIFQRIHVNHATLP